MPSYVTVNNGAEIKTINIKNECLECIKNNCQCGQVSGTVLIWLSNHQILLQLHQWELKSSMIKSVSPYKKDDRCVFLYVRPSDDFQMYFPNKKWSARFIELVSQHTSPISGLQLGLLQQLLISRLLGIQSGGWGEGGAVGSYVGIKIQLSVANITQVLICSPPASHYLNEWSSR